MGFSLFFFWDRDEERRFFLGFPDVGGGAMTAVVRGPMGLMVIGVRFFFPDDDNNDDVLGGGLIKSSSEDEEWMVVTEGWVGRVGVGRVGGGGGCVFFLGGEVFANAARMSCVVWMEVWEWG